MPRRSIESEGNPPKGKKTGIGRGGPKIKKEASVSSSKGSSSKGAKCISPPKGFKEADSIHCSVKPAIGNAPRTSIKLKKGKKLAKIEKDTNTLSPGTTTEAVSSCSQPSNLPEDVKEKAVKYKWSDSARTSRSSSPASSHGRNLFDTFSNAGSEDEYGSETNSEGSSRATKKRAISKLSKCAQKASEKFTQRPKPSIETVKLDKLNQMKSKIKANQTDCVQIQVTTPGGTTELLDGRTLSCSASDVYTFKGTDDEASPVPIAQAADAVDAKATQLLVSKPKPLGKKNGKKVCEKRSPANETESLDAALDTSDTHPEDKHCVVDLPSDTPEEHVNTLDEHDSALDLSDPIAQESVADDYLLLEEDMDEEDVENLHLQLEFTDSEEENKESAVKTDSKLSIAEDASVAHELREEEPLQQPSIKKNCSDLHLQLEFSDSEAESVMTTELKLETMQTSNEVNVTVKAKKTLSADEDADIILHSNEEGDTNISRELATLEVERLQSIEDEKPQSAENELLQLVEDKSDGKKLQSAKDERLHMDEDESLLSPEDGRQQLTKNENSQSSEGGNLQLTEDERPKSAEDEMPQSAKGGYSTPRRRSLRYGGSGSKNAELELGERTEICKHGISKTSEIRNADSDCIGTEKNITIPDATEDTDKQGIKSNVSILEDAETLHEPMGEEPLTQMSGKKKKKYYKKVSLEYKVKKKSRWTKSKKGTKSSKETKAMKHVEDSESLLYHDGAIKKGSKNQAKKQDTRSQLSKTVANTDVGKAVDDQAASTSEDVHLKEAVEPISLQETASSLSKEAIAAFKENEYRRKREEARRKKKNCWLVTGKKKKVWWGFRKIAASIDDSYETCDTSTEEGTDNTSEEKLPDLSSVPEVEQKSKKGKKGKETHSSIPRRRSLRYGGLGPETPECGEHGKSSAPEVGSTVSDLIGAKNGKEEKKKTEDPPDNYGEGSLSENANGKKNVNSNSGEKEDKTTKNIEPIHEVDNPQVNANGENENKYLESYWEEKKTEHTLKESENLKTNEKNENMKLLYKEDDTQEVTSGEKNKDLKSDKIDASTSNKEAEVTHETELRNSIVSISSNLDTGIKSKDEKLVGSMHKQSSLNEKEKSESLVPESEELKKDGYDGINTCPSMEEPVENVEILNDSQPQKEHELVIDGPSVAANLGDERKESAEKKTECDFTERIETYSTEAAFTKHSGDSKEVGEMDMGADESTAMVECESSADVNNERDTSLTVRMDASTEKSMNSTESTITDSELSLSSNMEEHNGKAIGDTASISDPEKVSVIEEEGVSGSIGAESEDKKQKGTKCDAIVTSGLMSKMQKAASSKKSKDKKAKKEPEKIKGVEEPEKMKTRGNKNKYWYLFAKGGKATGLLSRPQGAVSPEEPAKAPSEKSSPSKEGTPVRKFKGIKRASTAKTSPPIVPETSLSCIQDNINTITDNEEAEGASFDDINQCKPCKVLLVDFIKCLDLMKSSEKTASPEQVEKVDLSLGQKIQNWESEVSPTSTRIRIHRSSTESATSAPPAKRQKLSPAKDAYEDQFKNFLQEEAKPVETSTPKATVLKRVAVDSAPAKKDPNNRYRCLHCNYMAASKFTMVEHIYNHTDIVPFSCGLCGAIFGTRSGVTVHTKKEHQGMPLQLIKKRTEITEEHHYMTLEEYEKASPMKRIPPPLPGCKINESTKSIFDAASEEHNASREDQGAAIATDMASVIKSADPSYLYYICKHCTYSTNDFAAIEVHVSSKHPNDRELICAYCKCTLSKGDSLIVKHFQAKHPGKQIAVQFATDYKKIHPHQSMESAPSISEKKLKSKESSKKPPSRPKQVSEDHPALSALLNVPRKRKSTARKSFSGKPKSPRMAAPSGEHPPIILRVPRSLVPDFPPSSVVDDSGREDASSGVFPSKTDVSCDESATNPALDLKISSVMSLADKQSSPNMSGEQFCCNFCDFSSEKSSLIDHLDSVHKIDYSFTCTLCNIKIKNHMLEHVRVYHAGDNHTVCSLMDEQKYFRPKPVTAARETSLSSQPRSKPISMVGPMIGGQALHPVAEADLDDSFVHAPPSTFPRPPPAVLPARLMAPALTDAPPALPPPPLLRASLRAPVSLLHKPVPPLTRAPPALRPHRMMSILKDPPATVQPIMIAPVSEEERKGARPTNIQPLQTTVSEVDDEAEVRRKYSVFNLTPDRVRPQSGPPMPPSNPFLHKRKPEIAAPNVNMFRQFQVPRVSRPAHARMPVQMPIPSFKAKCSKCLYCPAIVTKDSMSAHLMSHGPNIIWTCPYCPGSIQLMRSMVEDHFRTRHPGHKVAYVPFQGFPNNMKLVA